MSESSGKIYLYCIAGNTNPGDISKLAGQENNLFLHVSYKDICFIGERIIEPVKEIKKGILIHEKVIEEVMKNYDVLPMRFNSVVKDEISVQNILNEYYGKFKNNLLRIRGKAEYGIKVIWNYDEILKKVELKIGDAEQVRITVNSPAGEYLKKRFKKYKLDSMIENEADEYIDKINQFFRNIEHEKVIKKLQTEKLFLNASYLISRKDEVFFKKACLLLRDSGDQNFKFLFSGPWPPYNFVESITI